MCSDLNQLHAFRDGELSDGDAARMAGHVRDCADCRNALDELNRLSMTLRRAADIGEPLPSALTRRIVASASIHRDRAIRQTAEWLTAAAAVLMIGVLFFGSGETSAAGPKLQPWESVAVGGTISRSGENASDTVQFAEWIAADLSAANGSAKARQP